MSIGYCSSATPESSGERCCSDRFEPATQSGHWSAASIYPRNAVSTAGDEGAPIDGWNHRLGVGTIHYAWSE